MNTKNCLICFFESRQFDVFIRKDPDLFHAAFRVYCNCIHVCLYNIYIGFVLLPVTVSKQLSFFVQGLY